MQISIEKILQELDIGNGISFRVRDKDRKHQGRLYVRKNGLVWCEGKKGIDSGESVSWDKFINWISRKAAILIAAFLLIAPSAFAQSKYQDYVLKYEQADSGEKVDLGQVLYKEQNIPLYGFVTRPNDDLKQAAVIYLGGCNGRDKLGLQYQAEHLRTLRSFGYVVLNLDSVSSRIGQKPGGHCDTDVYGTVDDSHKSQDIMKAAEWLASQPYVDPARIGLWGFSSGGMPAMMISYHYASSYDEPKKNVFRNYTARINSIFVVYGHCLERAAQMGAKIRVNTMVVAGDKDNYANINGCKLFQPIPGIEYRVKTYPDVHHSYMLDLPWRQVRSKEGTFWFGPDPKAKADTFVELEEWFAKHLR